MLRLGEKGISSKQFDTLRKEMPLGTPLDNS